MKTLLTIGLLLAMSMSNAELSKPTENRANAQTQPDYDIGEFNKIYWRWKRCMNRWEQEHGPNDVVGATKICGNEPQLPERRTS